MSGITYKQLGEYLDLNITIPGLPDVLSKAITDSINDNAEIKPLKNKLTTIKTDIETKLKIDFTSTEVITPDVLTKIINDHIKDQINQIPLPDGIKNIILFLINNITVKISDADKAVKTKELTTILKSALNDLIVVKPPVVYNSLRDNGVDIIAPQIIDFMAMGAGSALGSALGPLPAPGAPGSALSGAALSASSSPAAAPDTAPVAALGSAPGALGTLPGSDQSAAPVIAPVTAPVTAAVPAATAGGGASRRSRCPRGSRRNKKTGDCVKVAGYTAKKRCPKGTRRSKTTGACEKFKMLLAKVDSSKRKTSAMLTKVADEALSEVADLKKADTELAAATKKCCAAASAAAALKRQKKTAANKARLDGKIAAAVARAELADKLEKEAEKDRADILAKIARLRKVMGVRKNEENPVELKRLIQQWTDESRVRIWKMSKE
jgi:hypothetical protein